MSTQRKYTDICAICGRELIGNGSKRYWSAHRIRELNPDFKGEVSEILGIGVPHERGAYVCRVRKICDERRKTCVKTS